MKEYIKLTCLYVKSIITTEIMRRTKLFSAILAVVLLAVPIMVLGIRKKVEMARTLIVTFDYKRQAGPGSNQYAVWIENEKGEVVKTLFVTSFTTKGRTRPGEQPMRGYVKRPACVPVWVKASKAEEQTDEQLDAYTGATPKVDGMQRFSWDFTDAAGKIVKKGTYKVFVEATLFGESDITYSGAFTAMDNAGEIVLTPTLTKDDEAHKDMVTNVKALLK